MDPGSQGSHTGILRFPGSPNVRDDRWVYRHELLIQDTRAYTSGGRAEVGNGSGVGHGRHLPIPILSCCRADRIFPGTYLRLVVAAAQTNSTVKGLYEYSQLLRSAPSSRVANASRISSTLCR